jgi:hypothetical protein
LSCRRFSRIKKELELRNLLIALALCSCLPAQAEDINKAAHISALVHTERDKRAKKFLYLVPGKIKFYHYEWVMPDGSTLIKVEAHKMPGVYDRRDLKESHPNVAMTLPVVQQLLLAGINAGSFITK